MKKAPAIKELEKEIRRHNRLYFELGKPEISDYEFDRLIEKLKKLRPDSPVLSEIPTDTSAETKEFKKIRHTSEMLSLDKCYQTEDLVDWASKFEGNAVAMPKIDGCATELRYNADGELVLAATRGNGLIGEDITPNARMIDDIPQKIPPPSFPPHKGGEGKLKEGKPGGVEIRGEIYMRLSVFKKYQETFANPRNLAAGAIKQKDPRKTHDYQLSFFGYDLRGLPLKTEQEKIDLLKSFEIPTVEVKRIAKEPEALQKAYDDFLAKRDRHDYETDGVVFKADLISEQERLGATAHHPRYAIAYKFQGDSGTTTLQNVEWNVSRTRTITPVGIVDPVELSGATVTHVSLHNYGLMKKLGLRKGAQVVMMRRGGVIPNLESVVDAGHRAEFEAPEKCPSCGSPTEICDDFLYCTNKQGCRKAKMEELEHFMRVIECDGFGEKLIEKLYDNGFVQDPADFYTLKKENLLELERMGEVLATKLIGNIQGKKELPLDLFLRSLGIRELAKHTAKILAQEFGTLDRILKISEEELSAIHTIGPVIAKEAVEGLKKKRPLIDKLLKQVRLSKTVVTQKTGGPLAGKKFLFTGSLVSMERSKAEKLVEEKGGEIASGVTKDLDYLIVGDSAGSKLKKAQTLQSKGAKVQILSETELKQVIFYD